MGISIPSKDLRHFPVPVSGDTAIDRQRLGPRGRQQRLTFLTSLTIAHGRGGEKESTRTGREAGEIRRGVVR